MLLLRCYIDEAGNGNFDFNSLIEIDFVEADNNKLIDSIESLFESIIKSSKNNNFIEIDYNFLKQIHGKNFANSLIKTILENLPIKNLYNLLNSTSSIRVIK